MRPHVRAVNGEYAFRPPAVLAAWRERAATVRGQILRAAGLSPMPARGPVRVRRHGRRLREGYTIEKLLFEGAPGLWVGANLWRPRGAARGAGRRPAVLHPHGHWEDGRVADDDDGSSIALCSNLARRGYIVLAWDMVGFGDTLQLRHGFHSP